MRFWVVFTRVCPRLWLLRATSRQRSKHLFARCHSVADAPSPDSARTRRAFRSERGCSLGEGGEESSPAPLTNETQNMNTTENLISNGCPAPAPQLTNKSSSRSNSQPNPRNGKLFHSGNVPHPTPCNSAKRPIRQPPILPRLVFEPLGIFVPSR